MRRHWCIVLGISVCIVCVSVCLCALYVCLYVCVHCMCVCMSVCDSMAWKVAQHSCGVYVCLCRVCLYVCMRFNGVESGATLLWCVCVSVSCMSVCLYAIQWRGK
eukprot:Opistho-2@23488